MSNTWDAPAFEKYVLGHAAKYHMLKPADIARGAGLNASQLSRWLRGMEQPSVPSLRKLAAAIRVPPRDLFAMAGRMSEADLEESIPDVPELPHPLVTELAAMLREDSQLSEERRERLVTSVDTLFESFRPDMRRRRSA